jgi:hypothetical protein
MAKWQSKVPRELKPYIYRNTMNIEEEEEEEEEEKFIYHAQIKLIITYRKLKRAGRMPLAEPIKDGRLC